MILKSIRLKNFRKFKDSYLEFPDGVTGIVGLNGVGKSTIFEAMAWVMYGAVATRTPMDQIKMENADSKDPCRVELEFIFSEDKYRIVREMTGKSLSTNATVTINEKLVASGAEVVSSFIQKKIGMDFKSFYTSIFAKQKELNSLSSMNPSERRPLILRMLGINSIDEIITEIRTDIKDKKNIIQKFELDLIDKDGVNKIERYKIKKIELEDKLKKIFSSSGLINKKISSIEKESKLLKQESEKNKKEYEKLSKIKNEIEEKKILFEKKKRLIEDIKELELKIKKRQVTIDDKKLRLKKICNLDQELKDLETKQKDNTIKLESALKKIEKNKTLINQLNQDIEKIKTKITSIEKIGSSAKCPTCERILGKQYDILLKNFNDEINSRDEKIKTLEFDRKKIIADYDKLINRKKALIKKSNFLNTESVEKEKIRTLINNISQELDKEKTEELNKNKELLKISQIEFNEKYYQSLRKNIETQYKKYQTSVDKYNDLRDVLEKAKIDLERMGGDKKLHEQEIKNLDQKIKEQNIIAEKIKKDNNKLQLLSMLNDVMYSFRTYLISQIRPILSLYASELFNQLTDGKYSEIELDENYNLRIYDNGLPYNIERFSGGEEDLANLCIRLAISEVITSKSGNIINLIILDEIFGSQDNMRKQNIINALSKFSSKFRQIFLITHVEDIKNLMENTISVFEDENGISKIKIS